MALVFYQVHKTKITMTNLRIIFSGIFLIIAINANAQYKKGDLIMNAGIGAGRYSGSKEATDSGRKEASDSGSKEAT